MAGMPEHNKVSKRKIHKMRKSILQWYDRHKRSLPWRYPANKQADPYRVWLSEIMLQQTTVQAVKAYYTKFLAKWPTVKDLAAAPQEEVLEQWAGLGYYARARNLHKCAQIVAKDLNGAFPGTQDELRKLPGIGDYTSAAITAIAFQKPATVMDGNIERIMARLFNVTEALPAAKAKLKDFAALFFTDCTDRPGDLAQALMDLGAGICTPQNPGCVVCPLSEDCTGRKTGAPERLPIRTVKKARPQKHGYVYWIQNEKGEILCHRRPPKGLLGGMLALPSGEWLKEKKALKDPQFFKNANLALQKQTQIEHTFTHFDLLLYPKTGRLPEEHVPDKTFFWATPETTADKMPSLFKKAFVKLYSLSRS